MANTITGSFGLDLSPLRAAANKAVGITDKMASSIGHRLKSFVTSPLAQVGAAIGAYFTYENFKSGIEGVIEAGSEMEKMRARTGASIGSLATLKALALETDTNFDSLATAVNKMQRNLFAAAKGGGPMAATLRLLHLDMATVEKLKPEEQFKAIGDAISKLPSPTARSAAAMQIFGRSGAELLPLFEQIGSVDFGNLSEKARLLEKDAESFHQITIAFRKANANTKNLFVGMADALIPILSAISQYLSRKNALAFGQTLGRGIGVAVDILVGIFKDPGALLDAYLNYLKAGYASAGNLLLNGSVLAGKLLAAGWKSATGVLVAIGPKLATALASTGGVLRATFSFLKTPETWQGLTNALISSAFRFSAELLTAIDYLQAGFDFAVQIAKNISFTDAVKGFQSEWVHALLDPIGFLAGKLSGIAVAFGKSVFAAMRGNLGDLGTASGQLLKIAANPTGALIEQFTAMVSKANTATQGPRKTYAEFLGQRQAESAGLRGGLISRAGEFSAKANQSFLAAADFSGLDKAVAESQAAFADLGKTSQQAFHTGLNDLEKAAKGIVAAHVNKDFFGAAEYRKKAAAALEQLRKAGENTLASFTPKAAAVAKDPWARFANFATFAGPSLHTGGLKGAGIQTSWDNLNMAYAQSSLLSGAERRGFADAGVARGEERQGSLAGAHDAVRAGDAARRKAFEKQQLRQQMGVEKTNTLLQQIMGKLDDIEGQ